MSQKKTSLPLLLLVFALSFSIVGCGSNETSPPPAPTQVQLTQVDNQTVRVSWQGSDADVSYNVYRSTSPGASVGSLTPLNGSSPVPETQFLDAEAANTTTYFYQVTAQNEAGQSESSDEREITTPYPTPPDRP